jgi:hypothetical protein
MGSVNGVNEAQEREDEIRSSTLRFFRVFVLVDVTCGVFLANGRERPAETKNCRTPGVTLPLAVLSMFVASCFIIEQT